MRSMSSGFYNFLANEIFTYFSGRETSPGEKFHLQLEKEADVSQMVDALEEIAIQQGRWKQFEFGDYGSFSIASGPVEILVAGTQDGVTEDFLIRLRNLVGTHHPTFQQVAVLFVHHTTLDSISGGATSLLDAGLPLSRKAVKQSVKNKIDSSQLSAIDKTVLQFVVDELNKSSIKDNHLFLYEYADLLSLIDKGLTADDYPTLEIFFDAELKDVPAEKQMERLQENHSFFKQIQNAHQYGNPLSDLDKLFDQEDIEKKIGQKGWSRLPFSFIQQSHQKKSQKTPPEIQKFVDSFLTKHNLPYLERFEADTKVKRRKRHVLIFQAQTVNLIQFSWVFDRKLEGTIENQVGNAGSISRNRLNIRHVMVPNQVNFLRVKYKESGALFEFKIAIVPMEQEIFPQIGDRFLIDAKKRKSRIQLLGFDGKMVWNEPFGKEKLEVDLDIGKARVSRDQLLVLKGSEEVIEHQGGKMAFDLIIDDILLPLTLIDEVHQPKNIVGMDVYKLKRELQNSFHLSERGMIEQGSFRYYLRDKVFLQNLQREQLLIEKQALALFERQGQVERKELSIPHEVREAYLDLVQFFTHSNTLPSLAYLEEEYQELAQRYVETYLRALKELEEGTPLFTEKRDLAYLGTVMVENRGEQSLRFSPLHPLNVAYQLTFYHIVGDEDVPIEVLKRLGPTHLCPYLYQIDGQLFQAVSQSHSPEWIYYEHGKVVNSHSQSRFVARLVADKIAEFTNHYHYLFAFSPFSPIRINLINLGDGREVLKGIFQYYLGEIKKGQKLEELHPIQITIYGQEDLITAFDEFTYYSRAEEVCEAFDLKLKNKRYSEDELINLFQNRIQYYKKSLEVSKFEYAHISFYDLDEEVEETYGKMELIETGLSLDGLMSTLTSTFVGGQSYRTGFGSKYLNESNQLIRLTKWFNSLVQVSGKPHPFEFGKVIMTTFAQRNEKRLQQIYESSHWVTFIEPQFNLNFFTQSSLADKLFVLHYSDQYTNSSSYDAITVTYQTEQFQAVIEEVLAKHTPYAHDPKIIKHLINLFNSLNGDWLLRMIGDKTQFPREKISILSAVKLSLAAFAHENLIWIPMSLEEVLRVSGAVGLSKSDAIFTAKNLGVKGATSDDLLMVGIELGNEKPKVHFYPIEVKIGRNGPRVIQKAIQQVQNTYQTIIKAVCGDRFIHRVYRDFLIQLALVTAKKMKCYDVWPEFDWDRLFDEKIYMQLISDQFEISTSLQEQIGIGGIISFGREISKTDFKLTDQVGLILLPEVSGYHLLTLSISEILWRIHRRVGLTPSERIPQDEKPPISQNDRDEKDPPISQPQNQGETEGDQPDSPSTDGTSISDSDGSSEARTDEKVELRQRLRVLFGHTLEGKALYWEPTNTNQVMHTNTGIIGTMGTGKTQFTKSLVTQLVNGSSENVKGTKIGFLIFDYKGDYIKEDFIQATQATVYPPYRLPFNPLALFAGNNPKPLLPLHTASMICETVSKAFNLGIKQQQLLKDLIMDAYEEKGIDKANQATWNNPPPTFYDVYRKFTEHKNAKEDSLAAALKNIVDYELFSPDRETQKTLFDLIDGVVVINLAGYDPSTQNLIVAMMLDSFYSQMVTKGHSAIDGDYRELTKMILVDEADNFLSKDFASLRKILKEGREFGVGTILSTQFLSHFVTADNDYTQYILTWIVHRVAEIKKREVQNIFNTSSQTEADQLLNQIRQLSKHHSIVTSVSDQKYIEMEDMPFWKLI